MPRAFLITNKRYKQPGVAGAGEAACLPGDFPRPPPACLPGDQGGHFPTRTLVNTDGAEVRVSDPRMTPDDPCTTGLPADSVLVLGDIPGGCPAHAGPGGEDVTLSPTKASSPSMSPSKPDSPAHSSRILIPPSPTYSNHSPPAPGGDLQAAAAGLWTASLTSMFRLPELSELQHVVGAQTNLVPSPGSGAGGCGRPDCGQLGRTALDMRGLIAAAWGGEVTGPLDEHHPCPDCGKAYSTSSNLARHRQTHRSVTDKKARKCPHCDKVYVSMPAYSMHVRTHSQGCQCAYCGKRFSRPWLLQGHIRTHTGEKPFTCPQCGKAFADKSNLRAHIQTHSSEKPYACGRCGKAFALKSYLYKHEESSCMRGQRLNRTFHRNH